MPAVHDRACGHRGLLPAGRTFPARPAPLQFPAPVMAAGGADEAVGPAPGGEMPGTGGFIGKARLEGGAGHGAVIVPAAGHDRTLHEHPADAHQKLNISSNRAQGDKPSNYFKRKTGTRTEDNPQFIREFWELSDLSEYRFLQSVPKEASHYGGRISVILWQNGFGVLNEYSKLGIASIQGMDAWGQEGIAVGLMGKLPATIYGGQMYDMNTGVIYGGGRELQAALYAWINSGEYHDEIRKIDQQLKLTTATFQKVNFDLERWIKVAKNEYRDGLPDPSSDDPTQWLFHGHPANAAYGNSVHIALARLNGFRWPAETDPDMRLSDEARA